jgi:hypothetical protein
MQPSPATEIKKVLLHETQRITSGSTFVHSIVVKNSTASDNYEVQFTDNDGTEILSMAVPATETREFRTSFFADNGLIITGLNDSGVAVTLAYSDDTVPVAAQAYADGKDISFDGSEWLKNKAAGDLLSIENAWSIQCIHKNGFTTLNSYLVSIQSDDSNKNQISWLHNAGATPEAVEVQLRNSGGTIFKNYDWDIDSEVDLNRNFLITWDGTTLTFYSDGVDQVANVTKNTDDAGTMADGLRELAIGNLGTSNFGSLGGDVHSVSVWDVALTAAEVLALHNGGSPEDHDNRFALGNYASEDNLMHYYRLGLDKSDLGRDWGNADALVKIDEDPNDITAADITDY